MIGSKKILVSRSTSIIFVLASAAIFTIIIYSALSSFKRNSSPITKIPNDFVFASKDVISFQELIPLELNYGLPVRLIISKINVDATILSSGLTEEGSMEVPSRIEDLGWYEYGPRPGMKGSAVIAGHHGVGQYGVFMELNLLEVGDTFSIIDDRDQTISFIVREIKSYDPTDKPAEVFFSDDGIHLNLITCSGDWDVGSQDMTQRLVVFSDKI